MIGNDLVYLPNWKRRSGDRLSRFRQKIYTEKEIEWIEAADNPFLLEAKFWAVKEAVYKSAFKKFRERKFTPKSIDVVDFVESHFSVIHRGNKYFVTVDVTNEFIHAVTSGNSKNLSFWGEEDLHYKSEIIIEGSNVEIVKDRFGVPHGQWKNRKLDLSISHDGGVAVVDVAF